MTGQTDEDAAAKAAGWRGSRELWLEAAKQAFVDGGLEAVKIQPLGARLNLSRTSFYWFFKDRGALLDALLAHWEAQNTGAIVTACAAYAETLPEAVLSLIGAFLDETGFEPRFDFAVRGWAHGDAGVAAQVQAADEARLAAIREMFRRFGVTEAEADVRARTVYLTQMGYISMQVRETLETRLLRVADYVTIFAGQPPTPADMARFRARFGVA
ncbi:TetR/AcrR family transcriptional regulator [Salipiger sp. P9]|uniref:TetR/AcrR family transcriptional regulator n=1 Tax=Salipiger pentaromativorans TaxID=2943193 RepID=UPI002157FEB0|nr:TetR/AcrR family transcriptional regulator [Salipiger pentaromativorans]MCR8549809.1 TetR/AcrR family transcriptional regulator [Salipiger pentaromativorans]